ncbi:transglycosylase family protein [Nocardia vulneris]|uniref:transglycosylase family protein n=1 Tax=Nocardia vulneris TaxID=1141657 RepID=UPI0030D19B2D
MSGRHRKKISDHRALARIAIIGSVLGSGGAAFAGNAVAATQQDWNDLAECESGGNWATNTGNGYYGGLQIAPGTWAAYGGHQYGASADKATPEQQIEVAERILAAQTWGAWPACSASLGLQSKVGEQDGPQDWPSEQEGSKVPSMTDSENSTQPDDAHAIVDRIHRTLTEAQSLGITVPQPVLEALNAITLT